MRQILYRTGRTPLLVKISVGFVLGIIFGFIAAPMLGTSGVMSSYVMPFLDVVGKIFLRLLAMIIVPLVFSSLVSSVAGVEDTKMLGRIGAKTIALYLITTLTAIFIGLAAAHVIRPGNNIDIPAGLQAVAAATKPVRFHDMILDIFPSNPITAMVNANMIQIIVFALFVGVACIVAGDTGRKFAEFFGKAADIMYSLTRIVMNFSPYGVFALIATTAANFGLSILVPFVKIIAAVYAGCFVHAVVVYSLMVMMFCRRSPFWFFRGIQEAAITAFVTRSSSVTLPVTIANVRENLGVSDGLSSFVLPLGATINMDGTAIYQVVCALFVARAYNMEITFSMQAAIVFASLLASVGTAGVPTAGLIMLTMVLASAGLPVEGVGLVAGIDVILSAVVFVLPDTGNVYAVGILFGEFGAFD